MLKYQFPLTCHRSTDLSHWKYTLMLPTYNMRSRHGFGHPLVSFPKLTDAPRGLKKNEQFCQIRRVASLTVSKSDSGSNVHTQNTPPTVAFYSE